MQPTPIQSRSAWVGCLAPSVCLFVCLSVCPQHNSKKNDPKVFKLGIGNDLGMVLVLKGQRSRSEARVNKCIVICPIAIP